MRVSLTLTATSQVHIDDEDTSVTLHATPTGEATTASTIPTDDLTDWVPDSAQDTTASEQTEPSVDSPYEDPTEEGPVREGMYGPMHWLDDRHVTALLAPYICEDGTRATTRASLICRARKRAGCARSCLRSHAMTDRTTLRASPPAARCHPNRRSHARRICHPRSRWDERVSIDTVCVPESAIIAHTGRPIDDASCPAYEHWLTLAQVLGLGADAVPPDEMRFLVRDASSTRWWWAWWD